MQEVVTTLYQSPIGLVGIEADVDVITRIYFPESVSDKLDLLDEQLGQLPIIKECINQLDAYFKGTLKVFDLPLNPKGTDFQKKIWHLLTLLPYGGCVTYTQLADTYGQREAIRAVAKSNACNPILIVVPCHRVIGVDNKLTGYAGGLQRKQWLLQHEGVYPFFPTLDL